MKATYEFGFIVPPSKGVELGALCGALNCLLKDDEVPQRLITAIAEGAELLAGLHCINYLLPVKHDHDVEVDCE